MIKKHLVLLIAFLFARPIFGQLDSLSSSKTSPIKNYFNRVIYPNEDSKNYLVTFNYQYMLSPIGKTFGTQGMVPNFGLNLARFFSHKIVLGLTLDIKLIKGFSNKKLSKEFISDFNSAFNTQYENPTDSVNAFIIKTCINDGPGRFFSGNTLSNIGIMFSLFPQKYGGILVQIKKGYREPNVRGTLGIKEIENGERESVPLIFSDNWSFELTLKPMAFFQDTYIKPEDRFDNEAFGNRFIVTLFYERLNFQSATFNGTNISKMVSPEFMNKYRVDNRFGIKLGFGIY
jgi:hypothetical protein